MPVARRPTPPPEAIKQTLTVLDSLNAWTSNEDQDEADSPKAKRAPLGYTPLAQGDRSSPVTGWRQLFDSESDNFNFGIGMVIICNAIVIGLETDYGRSHFTILEHVFNSIFVLEMMTRVAHIGIEYFTTPSYIFDFALVLSGTLDLWILPAMTGHASTAGSHTTAYQFSVLRLLRILRLLRVLRVIRLFRMFGQLLLMVRAFGKSITVVAILSILVFIILYALGIVCTQLIGHNADRWGEDAHDITQWFGDIPKSMATLFWIMFGSAWDPLLPLLTKVYPAGLVLAVFAAFMCVTVALLALIIGLISESLIIAQHEFKTRTLDKFAKSAKELAAEYTEELKELLEDEMDEHGAVDAMQLKQAVKGDSTLVGKLINSGVQIGVDGLLGLVESMSKGEKQNIGIDHYVEKLIHLSGGSSASAVVDLKYDLVKTNRAMESASGIVEKMKADATENRQLTDALSEKMDKVSAGVKDVASELAQSRQQMDSLLKKMEQLGKK